MRWNRWYVAKSYLNSALWIVPLVALLLENVVIRIVFVLHSWLDWIPWFGTTMTGATEALKSLTTAFIVFTFGSLLIVIQVASGQLSPRLIATTLLRNATGNPLFRLHRSAARIDHSKLLSQVAFGPERTIEQDSTFAVRVIVDIATKALSPAINDPTTRSASSTASPRWCAPFA
jgi:uncharacterized membrane protein